MNSRRNSVATLIATLTTRNALTDSEIADSLHHEIARERQEADDMMAQAIARGRQRTYYLSPAIFNAIPTLEASLATAEAALERNRGGRCERYVRGAVQQTRVELDIARELRTIRSHVAHTDPPDYWQRLELEANAQPIVVNPTWSDGASNRECGA
ncbi:hypothetical protein ASE86_13340 [Sphingomonas sp. Leaf33]|uniref:hypothetical protein n=1 Tax=Sphingomonas sp. Leaf33 TaxID=1736215 RepID=UPI0007005C9C|nr:hypothetical protein [Sphingomonas sp. Leaf33]KQN19450.1 hypothetical protein ASE86_13340 [Sphingomonas sp. Leaf33]